MSFERFIPSCLAVAILLLVGSSAHAQSGPSEATRELAARSLGLPQLAIATGAIVLTVAPFVGIGAAVGLAFDDNILGCEDWFTGEVDPVCEAEQRAEEQEAARKINRFIAGSVIMGAVGIGLIAIGIWRAQKIRQARRQLARFETADLHFDARSAQFSLRFKF